ncbi:vacuolar-type H+-ATPase catalytic subunit A/Vma1 [Rhodoligotrophos appendicifer]|uniref:hypothetical protein n=1 Tax=Rhodoligotrophos appendicifer TaxID=987056 RepID=UPI00117DB903|nr:hypothetical protein [Rhodoligotrophos appendicifer]
MLSKRLLSTVIVAGSLALGGAMGTPAVAQSFYSSNVISKLDVTSAQRSKLRAITNKSEAELLALLRQNNINPAAKPRMDKLMQIAGHLQAIQRRERQAVSKVLDANQMRQYDRIIFDTQKRVRAAAN